MKRLMICPYFGPLPPWWEQYMARWPAGYDMLLDQDLAGFHARVKRLLGIDCPIEEGGTKIHDYRAALGYLYRDELSSYDFWGHTDFDIVYGNVGYWEPDERLADLDVLSDHWSYVCGPWTLYRNTPELTALFALADQWPVLLSEPGTTGWVETTFTDLLNQSDLRVEYHYRHCYQYPELLRFEDGHLHEGDDRPVSFHHFRKTKEWPEVPTR